MKKSLVDFLKSKKILEFSGEKLQHVETTLRKVIKELEPYRYETTNLQSVITELGNLRSRLEREATALNRRVQK